jgi:predicted metal-dependent HD superfamily phosphohydrolase
MLEQVAVIFPSERWQESNRGRLAAGLAREFPSIFVHFDSDGAAPDVAHLSASQWIRRDFDSFGFDRSVDEMAAGDGFTLRIVDDRGDRPAFPIEVLNRCQRLIGRRNQFSQGQTFDRVLRRHRALHDLDKPLVRADYNHALDVWQWTLRLDANATLSVQLAALFHDIERLVSEPDRRVEHLAADYQQFKDAHAREGAVMTRKVLSDAGVAPAVIERVVTLIEHHERPSEDAEVALLNDADALSFFSLNSPGYADYFGPDQTRKKVAYTWNRMRESARAKLATVHLRDDVRAMLDEVRG